MDIVTVERSSVMLLSRVIISLREGIEREGGFFFEKLELSGARVHVGSTRYFVFLELIAITSDKVLFG